MLVYCPPQLVHSLTLGARCSQSSQCLQYQYANRLLKQNQSLLVDDPTGYLNNICHPQHCTLDSLCIVNPNPFDSNMTTDGGCCLGASAGMTCNLFSDGNSNCDINKQCVPNGDSKPTLQCINVSKTSTQWIGVIITLIGAATLNIGLNLQKLALRKRFEKRIKSDESEKEQALRRLSSITVSLSQLYKKASNASFVSNKKKEEIEMVQSESESQDTRQNSFGSMERQPRQLGQLRQSQIHSGDKPEFQTKLGMVGLLKNPRWMLGFLVFTIGNICNVIALQFAPQSLVAPLGSISLVVNVIIAPFMNNEKWSYRDVLGVILIVGGSSLVVAFAGSNQHDYCLAVLLSLFRKAATIVFLSFTGTMIIVIYLMIVFIEKNLDLTETRQDTMLINQALDEGRITAVDPVEPEQISREHRKSRLLADTNGLVVEIDEAMSPGGIAQRRLIVSERRASTDVKEEPAFEPKKKDDDTKSTKSMALVFTIGNEQHVSEELEIESPVEKEPPILQQRKSVEFVLPRKPFFKRMVDKLPFIEQFRAIQLIPRLEKPISLESVWVRMVLPFSYASLGVIELKLGFDGHTDCLVCKSNHQLADAVYLWTRQSIRAL
ncbi:magnesium transporter NIPA-domain-containing protein [Gorgonomyces haynaldii]|nr:magnesium transporter NIPA-domain-containing protein [Gorgonomyces haynaldii]